MDREFLTVADVVAEFPALRNVSAVYREVKRGRLVGYRVGGRLMVARCDLLAYMERCRVGGAASARKFESKIVCAG